MTNACDSLSLDGTYRSGDPPQERWRGPDGYTLLSWEVDFRSGGTARLSVRSPEGSEQMVEGVHLEIVEPERVVFTGDFGFAGATITFRRA
jgi:uncharacterized protein YndB with AHSA1/START domain